MRSIEQLTEESCSLPNASKILLIETLVESLEFNIAPDIKQTWINEAKKRRNDVHTDTVQTSAGDEALAQVRNIIEL